MALDINPQFRAAFEAMEYGDEHLVITGKAGVGKSTLLSWFRTLSTKNSVVLAPTGVAALNVGGRTIHHFFGFYTDVTVDRIRSKKVRPRNRKLYRHLETIIIDEVSMLRADLLDCIDAFLQMYGPRENQPFGGVQMIFIGDLYQLPPVVTSNNRRIFEEFYESPYFYSAHAFQDTGLNIIELEKIYRQNDEIFIGLLNRIRAGDLHERDLPYLNSRVIGTFTSRGEEGYITLTATNAAADEENRRRLSDLQTPAYTHAASIDGNFQKEYYPTDPDLVLKPGSQVMMLNNDAKNRWVNGSLGIVTEIATASSVILIKVRLHDTGSIVEVAPFTWEIFDFHLTGDVISTAKAGSFTQLPLRLAWAVTIHKGQGKTFDRAIVDIGRGAFAAGQVYVALSRCRTFEGLVLKTPIRKQDIITDPRVSEFLRSSRLQPAIRQENFLLPEKEGR